MILSRHFYSAASCRAGPSVVCGTTRVPRAKAARLLASFKILYRARADSGPPFGGAGDAASASPLDIDMINARLMSCKRAFLASRRISHKMSIFPGHASHGRHRLRLFLPATWAIMATSLGGAAATRTPYHSLTVPPRPPGRNARRQSDIRARRVLAAHGARLARCRAAMSSPLAPARADWPAGSIRRRLYTMARPTASRPSSEHERNTMIWLLRWHDAADARWRRGAACCRPFLRAPYATPFLSLLRATAAGNSDNAAQWPKAARARRHIL